LALALPFVCLGLGLLMVSRVRYVHLANTYLRGRRPFSHVVALMFLLAIFWWYKELTLAIVVAAYAASGPVGALVRWSRSPVQAGRPEPEADAAADQGKTRTEAQQRSA
jgi:phosphatidylserine synthase